MSSSLKVDSIGPNTATTLTLNNVSIPTIVITGGSIDNTPIGAITPSTGAFTTLSATTALPVTSGGTGATTASAARTALTAAASGANSDITSLSAPALGSATATTQSANDNSTKVATTAYLDGKIAAKGDSLWGSGLAAIAKLAIGADGSHLFADSSQTPGASWSAAVCKAISSTRANDGATANVGYTGVGFKPKAVICLAAINGTREMSIGLTSGAGADFCMYDVQASAGTYGITTDLTFLDQSGGTTGQYATTVSFDTDGFTLSWTRLGSSSAGNITLYFLCFR